MDRPSGPDHDHFINGPPEDREAAARAPPVRERLQLRTTVIPRKVGHNAVEARPRPNSVYRRRREGPDES